MLAEAAWAAEEGHCEFSLVERLEGLLERLGMCREIPPVSRNALRDAVAVDKKREGGTINTAIPVHLGEVRLLRIPMSEVSRMLDRVPVAEEK
jgi:3-dehydroquinate synthetase